MILRARVVLPISGPPIQNGAVLVKGRRIRAVTRWRELASPGEPTVDLGDAVLLPGLINAHCHLDYTDMAGHFHPPRIFTDWLKLITSTKAGWDLSDYANSWRSGAGMLLRTGTTTVADIEVVPQLLPEVWTKTPLRVFSFLEMIGITNRRPPQTVLAETLAKAASLPHGRCRVGFSPHAPYSTTPELLRLTAQVARRGRRLVCTHVAESALEYQMFTHGEGEMFDWLKRSGRDMADCGLGSPVQHLDRSGLLAGNLLAIHLNSIGRRDATLLAKRGVSVVHCPRSHSYFHHDRFPLRRLARAGVNLCIGTDSLATVCKTRLQMVELNMFEELRALAQREPSLSARQLLGMATTNGARALGMPGQLGQLAVGALADLIALPLAGQSSGIYERVLEHRGDVAASMIGGRWAIPPVTLKSEEPKDEERL